MSIVDGRPDSRLLQRAVRSLESGAVATALSTLSFWAAIVLPALYLPFLAVGIDSPEGLAVFLGLFGLHVAALVAGRDHVGPASE